MNLALGGFTVAALLTFGVIISVKVKLVNIRNDDITDGNPKLTLGLIWTIILHFQVSALHCLVTCDAFITDYEKATRDN